jgi:hypothetical protein
MGCLRIIERRAVLGDTGRRGETEEGEEHEREKVRNLV